MAGHGGRDGQQDSWSTPFQACALVCCGRTARTAVPIALIVGTILSVVNQGAIIAAGDGTIGTWVRVAVNYLVPFVVSSIGWLSARRTPARVPPRERC